VPEELFKLIVIIGLSLIVSFVIIVPVMIWRLLTRKPLLPKGKKIESPTLFYIGIIFFGGFTLATFSTNMPYFGSTFLLMLLACIGGLIAYKKGWRG
jgi:hypothetical protein